MMKYAKVIVDISLAKLDRTFTYFIPEDMREYVRPGVRVTVSFGKRTLSGYVLELVETPDFDIDKIAYLREVRFDPKSGEQWLWKMVGRLYKNATEDKLYVWCLFREM